jgi:cholest-4-en-3-one 26-monooxygenase
MAVAEIARLQRRQKKEITIMSQCPFANLVDPDTYSHGMPYGELRRINQQGGPITYLQDPITGIPYWAITGQAEMDFIPKIPSCFHPASA